MPNLWAFLKSDSGRVVLAIFAIVVSATVAITIFRLNRKRKALTYEYLSMTRLLSVGEEIAGRVRVLVDEKPVQNLGIVRVKITNNGTEPIKASDFERSISFTVANNTHIIDVDIVETTPESLRPELAQTDRQVVIKKTLLNPQDSITLKLLLADFDGKIISDARIEGVEMKPPRSLKNSPLYIATRFLPLTICLLFITVLWAISHTRNDSVGFVATWLSILFSGFAAILAIIAISFGKAFKGEHSYPNDYRK